MLPQVETFGNKLGETKGLIEKLIKLSKHSEHTSMRQGFHTKLYHSQLLMLKKRKMEENAFKFLIKVFIRLHRKNQTPYQDRFIPIVTVLATYTWKENVCVHNPFHKMFHPRESWSLIASCSRSWPETPAAQRNSSWMCVHSYKDPVGNFPFKLFSLDVLNLSPFLNADSKWYIRQILKLRPEGKAVLCSNKIM